MDNEALFKEVAEKIQLAAGSIKEASYSSDNTEVKLLSGDMQLVIYQNDKLVGYKIYPLASPDHVFVSDNDLLESEDIKESMRKEVLYILNEYIEKRISIRVESDRTWYGKQRVAYYINLTTPSGENTECKLPCINQIDFGL